VPNGGKQWQGNFEDAFARRSRCCVEATSRRRLPAVRPAGALDAKMMIDNGKWRLSAGEARALDETRLFLRLPL